MFLILLLHSCVVIQLQSMTLAEAKKLALNVLKQVMEDKINGVNVELATVDTATAKFRIASKAELDAVVATLDDAPLM